jgi:hypothetical protein
MSQYNNTKKYIYSEGEQIYDIYRKKKGIVKYLRNDTREKSLRQLDPTRYYYFIEYDDNSFDTYVSANDFFSSNENVIGQGQGQGQGQRQELPDFDYRTFNLGQKFVCLTNNKSGTVRYLRNDTYEKSKRHSDSSHYYYNIDFDDGTFETYMHGMYLKPI